MRFCIHCQYTMPSTGRKGNLGLTYENTLPPALDGQVCTDSVACVFAKTRKVTSILHQTEDTYLPET